MDDTLNDRLPNLPARETPPRNAGLTMVMDKGLSVRQAEDLVAVAGHLVDYVKFGFGTALVSRGVREKARGYREAGIRAYLGGTLFEAFLVRGQLDAYRRLVDEIGLDTVEVSDGSMRIEHDRKCELIRTLSAQYHVISEVGSKDAAVRTEPECWARMMAAELAAGAQRVIAEARESGNLGVYRPDGTANTELVDRVLATVPAEKVIWEAPAKAQQVWFIRRLGPNVSLGNIAPADVIPLETLRLGLRGDTFFDFLPDDLKPR